jgi:hypothetical protein
MSAQIIKLSDRRRTRRTPASSWIAVFAAYADLSLAVYMSAVNAAEQGLKAACLSR